MGILTEDTTVRESAERAEMLLAATVSVLAGHLNPSDRNQIRSLASFLRKAVEEYGIEVTVGGRRI